MMVQDQRIPVEGEQSVNMTVEQIIYMKGMQKMYELCVWTTAADSSYCFYHVFHVFNRCFEFIKKKNAKYHFHYISYLFWKQYY